MLIKESRKIFKNRTPEVPKTDSDVIKVNDKRMFIAH